ncbi:MAG: rhodanese-like domain-containing protein [Blastocatellia bacterium]
MRSKLKLRKQSIFLAIFWALSACLSVACAGNAPPPVPVSATPSPAPRAEQPEAPAAGHDHGAHELENRMPRIIPEELKRLVEARQAVIVDVRSAEDYRQAHIEGAINLPLPQIESGQYPKLPRDKRLISYCT